MPTAQRAASRGQSSIAQTGEGWASPLADRRLKARWKEAITRYRRARDEETSSWDERYEALSEVLESDPPLYLAGGYKTARAFLRAEAPGQTERTVRRYMRVAQHFDPEDESTHGIAKLDALLDYLVAVGGAPVAPAKVNLATQRVRIREGKKTQLRLFSEVSVADLRRVARAALTASQRLPDNLPPLVKAVKSALQRAKLGEVGVRLRAGKLDLGGVPVERLAAFANAISAVKIEP
jgi:hypothetical protein